MIEQVAEMPWSVVTTAVRWAERAGQLALIPVTLVAPVGLRAQGTGEVGPPMGSQAPPASLEDLDGNPVELLDYVAGRPAVIEFWASWCENCEALQPQLDEIYETYGDRLSIVAVAVAVSQSPRRVRRHLEEHEHPYPYLWDARGEAVRAFAAPTTSVVVILDAEGRVAYTGVGSGQDLVTAVAEVLGGSGAGRAPQNLAP
jgi:thiol-disulfide isomerase/thioredoxin